ncbi:unnamed protein product [Didymodactylos carnosus]|uniref:Uncharacterized protein n=1 Tax=Didymodactylos carnosus TaxID=1234261 RepID=A0A814NAX2_9BILA|nr:unnamed protein product [Didymodactylos carnosus]CAF1088013.1 unnamed protein product [Didymodactylos carnosus]CAF3664401.1 unnamed protein product [Didymodactylos carnosus]CAF3853518.1 unnamed protein product [Didymodactylos carnosus]
MDRDAETFDEAIQKLLTDELISVDRYCVGGGDRVQKTYWKVPIPNSSPEREQFVKKLNERKIAIVCYEQRHKHAKMAPGLYFGSIGIEFFKTCAVLVSEYAKYQEEIKGLIQVQSKNQNIVETVGADGVTPPQEESTIKKRIRTNRNHDLDDHGDMNEKMDVDNVQQQQYQYTVGVSEQERILINLSRKIKLNHLACAMKLSDILPNGLDKKLYHIVQILIVFILDGHQKANRLVCEYRNIYDHIIPEFEPTGVQIGCPYTPVRKTIYNHLAVDPNYCEQHQAHSEELKKMFKKQQGVTASHVPQLTSTMKDVKPPTKSATTGVRTRSKASS